MISVKSKQAAGAFLTMLGGTCWGLSGTMGQYMFDVLGMDSRWLVRIRLFLSGVLLLTFSFIRYGKETTLGPWRSRQERTELLIYGLAGVSLCQFLYFLTIQLSSAAVGTIMQDLSPIFIMLVTCLMAKRLPKLYEVVSILCALGGVFLLTTHGNTAHMAVPASALITGVCCAVCVMIYNVVPRHLMDKYPVPMLQGWAFLMGGTLFEMVFRSWRIRYVPDAMGCFGIAFVVLVGNVVAFVAYMQGVHYIGPSKGILYGFAEPVTAAIIAVAFLGSPFTVYDAAGFLLIFFMLVLISVGDRKEHGTKI